MKTAADRKKDEAIAKVSERLRKHLPDQLAESAVRFASRYYADVAPDEMADSPTEDLYGAVLAHWQLAHRRLLGHPLVRLYNPVYAEHGWQSRHTIIEIVCDDMPFLVDSIKMALIRNGLTIHLIIHPIMRIKRNQKGILLDVMGPDIEGDHIMSEALMHFEVDQETNPEVFAALRNDLLRVLDDVRYAVEDWPHMRSRLKAVIFEIESRKLPLPRDELTEDLEFLRWIENHHFTFIGFREYKLVQEEDQLILRLTPKSALGIFRNIDPTQVSQIPERLRAMTTAPTLLILTKSTLRSPVHRPAHLDYVGIKRFDDSGQVIGEWRFQGLYSSLVYDTRTGDIPLLRRKIANVIQRAALSPSSHAGRALQHILDTLPRDDMFQATDDELFDIAMGILHLQDHQRLKIFVRRDDYDRFVSVLVFVPKDRYTTELRLRIQEILLDAFEGEEPEFTTQFSESILARVHYIIRTTPAALPDYDVRDIEARIFEAMLSWEDRLRSELYEKFGEANGNKLMQRYGQAFPSAYRDDYSARTAVEDIKQLEVIDDDKSLSMHLYRPPESVEGQLRFKVSGRHRPMALSDALPMLERMGLRVLGARPYLIELGGEMRYWILNFDMIAAYDIESEVLEVKEIFQEAFGRVYHGEIENDGFNRLVLAARLNWREVMILRAVCKYLLQTQVPFSQTYMEQSLAENSEIARLLVKLFDARFNPQLQVTRRKEFVDQLQTQTEQAIDQVASLDEDRILRQFLAVITAILRTNYFQPEKDKKYKDYISFKLDPSRLPELPQPHPKFEIFVYSTRVEGIHLRGGMVARGGLRWSDRREDFRTEVLGLMKAQMVKNVVIVPVGAKGGFVAKQLPTSGDRTQIQQEVIHCYRTFIQGLLDITDNQVGEKIQSPAHVIRYDGDDPYLVVAADKGTATFSDIANDIALQYGFWLGDAFASGGTYGYDHKKMGITARGAWESVKRNFRELGLDTQSTPFTVVGIGDMSGDVFGNGMLLSKHIRLVAAFNHRHIFIDPEPDPAAAYRERDRLFKFPRSSWADYDPKQLSKGGGVYERGAKSIVLSPEACKALGIQDKRLTPNAVIQAILRAPVDLLWNGGIGTYVKASTESHVDVGDRANDNVRINANELRCRVIGEGGNLGLTQHARIEFARQGGLIYTDAIDNSAGVNSSDREVNIKILLNRIVANDDMTFKQRNVLLASMTEEVAQLVLQDNFLQTQAISVAATQSGYLLSNHIRLISVLEKKGYLNRKREALPNDEELAEREALNTGLTRPEIAVLLAFSKIKLYEELLDSAIHEDPYLYTEIQTYFPTVLCDEFEDALKHHSLRREITATYITNNMLNRMGGSFCVRMQEDIGVGAADVARAYTIAKEIFLIPQLWQAIEALDNRIAPPIQVEMIGETRRMLDRSTRWMLRNRPRPLNIATTIEQFAEPIKSMRGRLQELLPDQVREKFRTRANNLIRVTVPDDLALRIAELDHLFFVLDIAEVARSIGVEAVHVAQIYFELGPALDMNWLRDRIRELPRINHWHRNVRWMLRDELNADQRLLTVQLLQETADSTATDHPIELWLDRNQAQTSRYRSVVSEIKASSEVNLSMLSVAVRELSDLLRNIGLLHAATM
jgi:glutamate dehydrogenase